MGSIDTIRPLPTVLSSAINKSQQHQVKNSWELQELNLGLLVHSENGMQCAMRPPLYYLLFVVCFSLDESVSVVETERLESKGKAKTFRDPTTLNIIWYF